MIDSKQSRDEVDAGLSAGQVLDSLAYQKAMSDLRGQIVKAWTDCPVRDQEGQLLLLQLMKMTEKFEGLLHGYIQSGKMAEIKLDELRNESAVRRTLRKIV